VLQRPVETTPQQRTFTKGAVTSALCQKQKLVGYAHKRADQALFALTQAPHDVPPGTDDSVEPEMIGRAGTRVLKVVLLGLISSTNAFTICLDERFAINERLLGLSW
jgi:hypothetical protein